MPTPRWRPQAGRTAPVVAGLGLALAMAGCVGGVDGAAPVAGVETPDGFEVVEIIDGLDGPTQLSTMPDGRLLVAELNGGEKEGNGRVLAIDPDPDPDQPAGSGDRVEVLFDQLLTPTGVVVVGDEIWVMEQRRLSRGPLTGGALTTVLDDLPFNGRSETTLTATPDGGLLYGTSGSLAAGPEPVAGSGTLWRLDPDDPSAPTPVSAGFKNAYGHTFDTDGRLWVTEMSDGRFDGERAPDELVEVTPGVDHGWPRCIGDRVPVAEFGADPEACADGPPSQGLFEPGATPTSVVQAPWDPDVLLVALWVEQRVVSISTAADGRPHQPVDAVTGALRPQHLLVDGDRVLIVDFDSGRILALQQT